MGSGLGVGLLGVGVVEGVGGQCAGVTLGEGLGVGWTGEGVREAEGEGDGVAEQIHGYEHGILQEITISF